MRKFAVAAMGIAAATLAASLQFSLDAWHPARAAPATDMANAEADLAGDIPRLLKQYGVPSVSIAVVRDGAVSWTAVYGEQSPGVPATANTLYNIASMTKPITAEVVMRLVSEGKLSLDEPMSRYWIDPDIKNDPRHERLTPRLSLTHRTGFPNWRRETNKVLTFKFDPGTKSSYSGEGYEYVAAFLEKKFGERFDILAKRYVLDPIGMTQTSHSKRDWFKDRVALPFDGKFAVPDFAGTWMASDLVYSTPADYAKFLISVMNNEAVSKPLAVERKTIVDDAAPEVCPQGKLVGDDCPASLGFGLGWAVLRYKNETVMMHGGSDTGVKTLGYFVPERRFGVVIFTNGENGMKIARDVVAKLDPGSPFGAFVAMQAR